MKTSQWLKFNKWLAAVMIFYSGALLQDFKLALCFCIFGIIFEGLSEFAKYFE